MIMSTSESCNHLENLMRIISFRSLQGSRAHIWRFRKIKRIKYSPYPFILLFGLTFSQLGVMALGVSALGKKRHRVDVARRLIVGSLVASFENQKQILYSGYQHTRNVLFRVMDSSLPWWTEKDSWGRWSSTSSGVQPDLTKLLGDDSMLRLATIDAQPDNAGLHSCLTLPEAILRLEGGTETDASQSRSRIIAT
jgi:hypothetical protein